MTLLIKDYVGNKIMFQGTGRGEARTLSSHEKVNIVYCEGERYVVDRYSAYKVVRNLPIKGLIVAREILDKNLARKVLD